MKLIGSKLENHIKEALINSKQRLFSSSNDKLLLKTLSKIKPNLKTAYILYHLIEQGEDIFTIITDDKSIIEIEISRVDSSVEPICEIINFHQYKKNLRGKRGNLRLIIALYLINEDLK